MSPRSNRRPLSEAERDARRKADRARIEQAARALLTTDGWQRWVRVRATNGLSRYSLRNQWLIAIECHARGITATYVAGFRAFLALNRCVRKGEKAIRILAPLAVKQRDDTDAETGEKRVLFRTVPVFDVTMTEPLPGIEPVPLAPPGRGLWTAGTRLGTQGRGNIRGNIQIVHDVHSIQIPGCPHGCRQCAESAGSNRRRQLLVPDGGASRRSPDSVVRNYTGAAASHSSKLGPASLAPGFGSASPSA
jgi:hypothetical protein